MSVARLGFIGLGNWGKRLASVALAIDEAEVATCFARSAERREEFAQLYACRTSESLDEILHDPEVDGVVVATPHSTHGELVREAAAAGMDIFVEKPLALSTEDAEKAYEAASSAGIVLQVGHYRRRMAATRKVHQAIRAGDVGEVHLLEANFSKPSGGLDPKRPWRSDPREAPLGGMTALGIHMVDNFLYLGGPVRQVAAMSTHVVGHTDLDDVTAILFEFASGALGYIGTSLFIPEHARLAVHGTAGSVWSEDDGATFITQSVDSRERVAHPVEPIDPLEAQIREFANAARGCGVTETGGKEALEVVRVIDAIQRSVDHGGGERVAV